MGLEEARSSFKSQDDGLALEGGSVGLYVPLSRNSVLQLCGSDLDQLKSELSGLAF
jgi:hypothetical protein